MIFSPLLESLLWRTNYQENIIDNSDFWLLDKILYIIPVKPYFPNFSLF